MVVFAVVVVFGSIEATEQVVCGDPAVETLGFTRDNLDMSVAVGQDELGVRAEVCAHGLEQGVLLVVGEESHAGGGHQVDGSLGDFVVRDLIEGQVDKLLEMVGADLGDTVGEGGDAGVDLLALLKLDLGQTLQLCGGGIFGGGGVVLPLVDI